MKKTKEIEKYLDWERKVKIVLTAEKLGNKRTYEAFGVKRSTFYKWKKKYLKGGEEGLWRQKRDPKTAHNRIPDETVELILKLREEHHLGTWRIKWYLERYYDISVSESTVYRTLKRHDIKPLNKVVARKSMGVKRYQKNVPGHHVQVDVKFLIFNDTNGKKIKRYQYTAIDDATRIRALKVYEKHNQVSSIDFVDYVVSKFPFRIHTIQTDNGHEFQSKFHWHVQDSGMNHRFIKPGTPQHNGKVERSHLTDKREFYQLLDYTDDVDLKTKLTEWEKFYNLHRPHGAFEGKTPHEVLLSKLKS